MMNSVVGRAEQRVEAFGEQVGDLGAMAVVHQAFGELGGQAVGQRAWIMMSDNHKCVHGKDSCELRGRGVSCMLGISYLW